MATDRLSDSLRGRISYDGTRTPVKTALFLVVCLAWLLPGLVGHDPWKGDEAVVFGMVSEILRTGDWIVLRVADEPFLRSAPLFPWAGAAMAKLAAGWLPTHDAARLAAGLFMACTIASLSLTAHELMGERAVRVTVLLFIGCLGLLIRAHEMGTDLAGLAGVALGLYGLALARRRPWAGGGIAGAGIGIAFLGDGFLPAGLLAALAAALPFAGPAWRTRGHAIALAVAALAAAPFIAGWLLALGRVSPEYLAAWIGHASASRWSTPGNPLKETLYFAKILPWYAWPALPLAAWTVWRARRSLASRLDLRFPLAATVVFFAVLTLLADPREVNALALLLPLALLGVAEIDSLPRGAASALDWFGMTTFFLLAALLWLAWIAAMTGSPEGIAAWIRAEVPGWRPAFRFIPFALAALLTLVWLAVAARSLRTTRRALVNWTAGITMVWMLLMTLGLPAIDHARSYRGVAARLIQDLPTGYGCIVGVGLGDAQRALLYGFAGIRTLAADHPVAPRCRARLVQAAPGRVPEAGSGWVEAWRGSRPGDRNELFVLYRRAD